MVAQVVYQAEVWQICHQLLQYKFQIIFGQDAESQSQGIDKNAI